jgi:acid phosphatase (class A)
MGGIMALKMNLALLLLALPGLHAIAAEPAMMAPAQPYQAAARIDLDDILAPPPGAQETRKELDTLLEIQKVRTPEQAAECIADQVISVFRFADVLGDKFRAENLPKTNALFLRVLATVHVPLDKAQKLWGRKRPPLLDPAIMPAGTLPTTAAYPSGHATSGNLMGILLADLLPERSAELHARGVLFGYRRILAGVHYPSDVEAGKQSAAAIAQSLYQDPQFRSDFEGARTELRAALGLKAQAQEPQEIQHGASEY